MACKCLLISAGDFVNKVDLSTNIDAKKLTPSISISQDRYLRTILCEDFYNEITEEACDGTIAGVNLTLLNDYIKPALVFRSYADYLSMSNIKITPAGARTFREQDSDPSSTALISAAIDKASSNADYYERVLIQYLDDNKTLYPTWANNCGCVKKNVTAFKISGIGKGNPKFRGYKDRFYDPYDGTVEGYLNHHDNNKTE